MTITTHHRSLTTYTELTASMQTDPEARHHGGAASVSSSRQAFPVSGSRCATFPTHMEWVPDRERRVVPDMMAALCRRCPARQSCLLWALAGQEQGYWAGTTSNDREIMLQLDQDDVDTADWLQDLARNELTNGALHPIGEGGYFWYRRRGCRCGECKSANAQARAKERAKAKEKAA
ncbi:WhiB family transcriptional regulator [Nostocoides sp. F2B08]|uniref:WhiB family transcriptional regulator n=1 Tax=Nostocoides sp. F2B08 TaxID=2653936 RepID=UPI001D04B47B|nr:WhiB family transcriptional regulator [Tetrasphaera sp. F2B08]